jgi:hypothetical protein
VEGVRFVSIVGTHLVEVKMIEIGPNLKDVLLGAFFIVAVIVAVWKLS